MPLGQPCRVVDLLLDDDEAHRLRALGLCVGRTVILVQKGEPSIVQVVGSRIGIAQRLADSIQVLAEPST